MNGTIALYGVVTYQLLSLLLFRPISVSFLICTLGKETDMATTLRLDKFGEIIFLQWKQVILLLIVES